eukprot:6209520-Pleurochrysis_carterae.AAC.1
MGDTRSSRTRFMQMKSQACCAGAGAPKRTTHVQCKHARMHACTQPCTCKRPRPRPRKRSHVFARTPAAAHARLCAHTPFP